MGRTRMKLPNKKHKQQSEKEGDGQWRRFGKNSIT